MTADLTDPHLLRTLPLTGFAATQSGYRPVAGRHCNVNACLVAAGFPLFGLPVVISCQGPPAAPSGSPNPRHSAHSAPQSTGACCHCLVQHLQDVDEARLVARTFCGCCHSVRPRQRRGLPLSFCLSMWRPELAHKFSGAESLQSGSRGCMTVIYMQSDITARAVSTGVCACAHLACSGCESGCFSRPKALPAYLLATFR